MKLGYYGERQRLLNLQKRGFVVFRVSGSVGPMDLICLYPEENKFKVHLEQVKTTRSKIFRFNSQSKYEWNRLLKIKEDYNINSQFSILFKNKGWKFVSVEGECPKSIKFSG